MYMREDEFPSISEGASSESSGGLFACEVGVARNFILFPGANSEHNPNGGN
jgi:hypothetical protein